MLQKKIISMMGMASALPLMSLMTTGCRNACKTSDTHNPNIVIILADDLGYGNIGVHGSIVPTPNIDKIFNQGIELTRHYAASMAYNMQVAFATTVVGLFASAIGFITQQVKQRWYLQDMTQLEFLAELLNENRKAQ